MEILYNWTMTIDCYLDERTFSSFTRFDIFTRRKGWKSPMKFATLLTIPALVCFVKADTRGAVLLGTVLLVVGWGMPLVYMLNFYLSVRKASKDQKLDPPRLVYTVELTEAKDGIHVSNEKEKATYLWKNVYHAYQAKDCIYLYITEQRAFLLPVKDEEAWLLILRKLGTDRCTTL